MIWTDPYVDAETKELVITVAVPIYNSYNSNEFVGVLGVDLSLDVLSEKINEDQIGESSYPVLLDKNKRIIMHENPELIGEHIAVEELNKLIDEKYEGSFNYDLEEDGTLKQKLFSFKKIDKLNWTMLVVMDKDSINEDTSSMLSKTIIFGMIFSFIAVGIALVFSQRLTKNIANLLHNMERIKKGNFTVRNSIQAKDEVGKLADGFNLMIEEISGLINNVQSLSSEVKEPAHGLAITSEKTSGSSEKIANTVDEIARGASEQAIESEKGAVLIVELADKLYKLTNYTEDMICSAKEVIEANLNGVNFMDGLQEKNRLNGNATSKIENAIIELDSKTKK